MHRCARHGMLARQDPAFLTWSVRRTRFGSEPFSEPLVRHRHLESIRFSLASCYGFVFWFNNIVDCTIAKMRKRGFRIEPSQERGRGNGHLASML